jgi:flagellar motor switch protein FliM
MLGADDDDGGSGGGMGGSSDMPVQATRVLNQDEIDSLLGFSDDMDTEYDKGGIQAVLNSSMVSYERLPMLEIVFDRLVRMMATSLRNFTQDNVEVTLDNIFSLRFGDYLHSIPLPAILAVFKAEEWDNYGLMTIDSSLVYSIVDVLLGGRRGTAAMRIEGRPYTTIELNLVKDMIELILSDLSVSFDPITSINFSYDRLETNPRFATISRLSNAVVVARLRIDMEDRGGKLDLMIPYATLEPVRELLLQMFMGERYGRDTIWENHLIEELWDTDVEIKAILKEKKMKLGEIAKWEKGSYLPLDISSSESITLVCGDVPLLQGAIGRKSDNVVIKVKGKADRDG